MKGFIEVPYEKHKVLINTAHIIMVEPLESGNDVHTTEIHVSIPKIAETMLRKDIVPNQYITSFQSQTISVILPYADVLNLIKEALE